MLIGLDMDGVIADWDGYLDRCLEEVPELHDFPRAAERGWHDYGKSEARHKKHVYKILEHPNFYGSLSVIPGAVEAAKSMIEHGHDVVYVSSPWQSNPRGYQDKADWLKTYFGREHRANLILTADKTIIDLDVLVDDKPVIKGRRARPTWTRVLFDQTYNRDVAGPRIMNWTDGSWEDVLYALPDALR